MTARLSQNPSNAASMQANFNYITATYATGLTVTRCPAQSLTLGDLLTNILWAKALRYRTTEARRRMDLSLDLPSRFVAIICNVAVAS